MSTQASQRALAAYENASLVAASTASFQDRITEELTGLYAEVLEEGETMPDLGLIQTLDGRLLARWDEEVLTADCERLGEAADRLGLARRRPSTPGEPEPSGEPWGKRA